MKRARVLSTESKVYHRPACRYVKRIQYAHRMELMPWEAKQYGYRPCKCCNSMAYLYDTEWNSLDYFERKWDGDNEKYEEEEVQHSSKLFSADDDSPEGFATYSCLTEFAHYKSIIRVVEVKLVFSCPR